MNLTLLGYGSIGKRHAAILREMGHDVLTVDPDPKAEADCENIVDHTASVWHGALICTPTGMHAKAVQQIPSWCTAKSLFVEKPMGAGFEQTNVPLQVGFCYYYDPTLQDFVRELSYERIYSLQIVAGHDLRAWHDEPYQQRYHGTPGAGGVINDSLSHSLFIARWILGDIRLLSSHFGRRSGLDLQTEDTCSVHLVSENAVPCYALVDYLRNPREFYIEAVTTVGTMRWEHDTRIVDAMYRAQMEAFVQVCAGELRYGFPDRHAGEAVDRLLKDVRDYVAYSDR